MKLTLGLKTGVSDIGRSLNHISRAHSAFIEPDVKLTLGLKTGVGDIFYFYFFVFVTVYTCTEVFTFVLKGLPGRF